MNKAELVSRRLHNQKLSSPDFRKPVDVVRWFGAVQSQDFEAAKWAVALRMRSATHDVIQDAFNCGTILRTHLMRPTWHFVAHDDIRWLLELTAPHVNQRCGGTYRKLELDDATFKLSHKVFEKALKNENHVPRSELRRKLNESGVAANDSIRLGHILIRAELAGVVCSGPKVGKQFTYALLDERVPAVRQIDRDEALAELTRRYLRSHGPATLQDFIWWSGLSVSATKRGLELLGRDAEKMSIEERVYWNLRSKEPAPYSSVRAHLLPVYDEYFVAYKDRQAVFDSSLTTWGSLGPAVILDGRAVGTWKPLKGKQSVEVKLIKALKKTEHAAIGQAARRYAEFLGTDPATFALFR